MIVVGVLAVVWLVASSLNPMVPALPSIEAPAALHRVPWMPNPAVLLCALASLGVMLLGATMVSRQNAIFEANKRETEDRLRRVREYGGDGRYEPYIGSIITVYEDKEPS